MQLSKRQQDREIMKEFKIEFMGPQPSSKWPAQYSDCFEKIRDIGRSYFEDLGKERKGPEDKTPSVSVRDLKRRVLELKRSVVAPGDDPVNESTLRAGTEHLVFSRFSAEVKCNTCKQFLWLSEFQALPSDPVQAEKLEKRRAQRRLCQCSPDQWTSDGFDDKGETLLFGSFSDEFVSYDPSERLAEQGVERRKPDLVIALKGTKSVVHYQADFDLRHSELRLRHSPFKRSGLFYPFLVVESKSEENSPGFDAIQRQTAFPIRTCLKLQQDLKNASGEHLDPLVWFFAYQADVWRVSACVVNDGKYQIFDLWMNRILDLSGALQLLRIVDHVACWARDVYRLDVLTCLAGGRVRVLQPRGESIDTYASRFSVPPSLPGGNLCRNFGSLESGSATSLLAEEPDEEDTPMEDFSPTSRNENMTKCGGPVSHPFLRWVAAHTAEQDALSRELTIRHSNMVLFNFVHLSIPENARELVDLLKRISRLKSMTTEEVAAAFWLSISSQATSVATTTSRIHQIKIDWLKLTPLAALAEEATVRAIFSIRTFLRSSDWQVVREMRCISCSHLAAQKLASLAGVRSVMPTEWAAEINELPSATFEPWRSLTGRLSASAACTSRTVYLALSESLLFKHSWVLESNLDMQTKSTFIWLTELYRDKSVLMLDTGSKRMAVIPKLIPDEIRRLFSFLLPVNAGAVLLHSEWHDTASAETWCLMVFEEVDFQNDQVVGRMLANVKANGYVFTLTRKNQVDEMTALDKGRLDVSAKRCCIDWWIEKLLS